MTDIFDRYPEFRGKPAETAMMCNMLCERGRHDDALALALAAVADAPDDNAVRATVRSKLSDGVPRYHIPMVLDAPRNHAYLRAIERMVRPGMTVLEIGTGAGLLAMMAARAGARVYTCEEHPAIAAAAARNIARNGLSDRITLIRKRSTELTVPDDLPEPADLILHEIFGSTLFDEGVTGALTDARKRLLKPGAPSLPPRAHVRCMLVRMPEPARIPDLTNVEGFDLSGFELLDRPSTSLGKSRARALEQVTDAVSALAMDYDSPPPFGPAAQTITVASRGGRIDGIVQWIALKFDDGHVMENDPRAGGLDSSWGVPYTELARPLETVPGQPLDLTLRHRGNLLTIDVAAGPPR